MRRLVFGALGFSLMFGAAMAAVFALILAGVAVGGHLLAARDSDAARVISFDPSSVARLAPFPAAASLFLFLIFVAGIFVLRRAERLRRGKHVSR